LRLFQWDRDFGVFFGTGKALGLDSVTFLVSIVGLLAIGRRFEPAPDATNEPIWASMRSGLTIMIADRVLRRDQLIWSLYSVLGGSIVLGLVYIGTRGGSGDAVLATLAVAAYAAGSAVGTLLAGRFANAPSLWLAEAAGLAVAAAGAALLAVGGVPAIIAGGALFGVGEGLVLVFHLTLRAKATPDGWCCGSRPAAPRSSCSPRRHWPSRRPHRSRPNRPSPHHRPDQQTSKFR
jgi:hypothetical protein